MMCVVFWIWTVLSLFFVNFVYLLFLFLFDKFLMCGVTLYRIGSACDTSHFCDMNTLHICIIFFFCFLIFLIVLCLSEARLNRSFYFLFVNFWILFLFFFFFHLRLKKGNIQCFWTIHPKNYTQNVDCFIFTIGAGINIILFNTFWLWLGFFFFIFNVYNKEWKKEIWNGLVIQQHCMVLISPMRVLIIRYDTFMLYHNYSVCYF